jgi:hypothetical protein
MVSSMWNLMLRCLRRVRTGECGPEGLGAGETATLFLPKILVLPLLGKLKLVARVPFGIFCPIAIFPFRLLKSTGIALLHRIVTKGYSAEHNLQFRLKKNPHQSR